MAHNVRVEISSEVGGYAVQRKLAEHSFCYGVSFLHGPAARPTLWLAAKQGIWDNSADDAEGCYSRPSRSLVDCRTILGILAVLLVK
jgi:hypothetical protein